MTARRALLAALAAAALALAWLGALDAMAREQVEAGLKRALITYASARVANAVISVLQETSVAVSPLGVGVTTSPGQALDPLNDLIEQFSTLMLAASVSLGMQLVLISVGSLTAVSALLTAAVLGYAWMLHTGRAAPRWLARALVVLLFVRFAVPLAALASEGVYRIAMAEQYAASQAQVEATARLIARSAPEPEAAPPEGRMERLERWFSDKKREIGANFAELKAKAENAVRHIVALMALFVVQTILFPLLFLWLAYRLFRGLLAG